MFTLLKIKKNAFLLLWKKEEMKARSLDDSQLIFTFYMH